jgi:hypothetical protein
MVAKLVAAGLITPSKAVDELLARDDIDLTQLPMHFFCKDIARGKMSLTAIEEERLREEQKKLRKLGPNKLNTAAKRKRAKSELSPKMDTDHPLEAALEDSAETADNKEALSSGRTPQPEPLTQR